MTIEDLKAIENMHQRGGPDMWDRYANWEIREAGEL